MPNSTFYVARIPFRDANDGCADHAICELCGMLVDVGGEIQEHANEHTELFEVL